jgi:hypothetical protein
MNKITRYKSFWFDFNDNSEDNINFIRKIDCEYMMFYEAEDTKIISGFIRFKNQQLKKSVENKFFLNKATIIHETRSEKKIKAYYSELYKVYEYGTPSQKGTRNDIIKPSKILENKDETLAKKDEQIDQLIRTLQEYKTSESELIVKKDEQMDQLIVKKDEQIDKLLKQIADVCVSIAKNSPSITNNNTTNNNTINNNKFNLNIFLNETCKNAINLIDFVKGIQIELQDLLLYNKIGHADAVSKIFDNAYKKLEPSMRPVHCTDVKRETVYVRDENKWLNDENKELSEKALTIISTKSLSKMNIWKEANPDYETADNKKIEFMKLMKNVLGANSNYEEVAQSKRMIRNLAQITHLNKDQHQIA